MIYSMARDIAEDLASRLYPVTVSYGGEPLRLHTSAGCYDISISREPKSDAIRPPTGSHSSDPLRPHNRVQGVVAEFRVASGLAGARLNEHENACDDLVDAFIVALYEWAKAAKAYPLDWGQCGYEPDDDASTQLPGVRYVLRFGVPRGIAKRKYAGYPAATATVAGVATSTTVVYAAGEEEIID